VLRDDYVCMFAAHSVGAPFCVEHADTEGLIIRRALKETGFKLSGCIIWVKNALVSWRSDYQWRHEPILFGWKRVAEHPWFGARNKTTVFEAQDLPFVRLPDVRYQIDLGETSLIVSGSDVHVEEVRSSVIRAEKPKRNGEHPTMKPVELIWSMLKNS